MTTRGKCIVFLVPGFPKDEDDTTCLPAIQNHVAAVADAYPEVDTRVVAFQYPFTRSQYAWKKATVHALGGSNRRKIRRLMTWSRAFAVVAGISRRLDVRVIHSFWLTECSWVGSWMSRIFRVPLVASIAGQDALPQNPYLRRLNLSRATVTAGSDFAAQTFSEHSDRGVDHVIPLGLDVEQLATIPGSRDRSIDVLGVGSLIDVKNYAAFIDVIGALVERHPQISATIVGDGPLRESLQVQVDEMSLGKHVKLVGAMERTCVFELMLQSKIFLHTARYESQGYVFLEALFAGLPIVSFDVGYAGRSEAVRRCTSVEEMAAAIDDEINRPRDFSPWAEWSTIDSVAAFAPLYGLDRRDGVTDKESLPARTN